MEIEITDVQKEFLRAESERLGITETELLQLILSVYIQTNPIIGGCHVNTDITAGH